MNQISGMRDFDMSIPNEKNSKEEAMEEELNYSAIWNSFSKKITENHGAFLICDSDSIGVRNFKELVNDKIENPVFFKGSFRIFNCPKVEDGKVIDFVMTSDRITLRSKKRNISNSWIDESGWDS